MPPRTPSARIGAAGEGRELGVGRVDAERAAGDFVLAQRFPGAADRKPAQADGDEVGEQREREDHVIEKDDPVQRREFETESLRESAFAFDEGDAEEARTRNASDAVGAAGEGGPIDDPKADELAERERYDRKIVAAQPQHREAEQDA